jgi:hypothetical protein
MNELDEVWAQKLSQATANARAAGRIDVADYLNLKATNDLIRQTSVKWLFDSMTEIAARNNRGIAASSVTIESENPHRFDFAKATMVGSLLRLRQGVRCLTLEAGWTRTPADGFMRHSALAAARVTHFGITKANQDLILLRQTNDVPEWFSIDRNGRKSLFNLNKLEEHFRIFAGK